MIRTGGKIFNPDEPQIYFLAADAGTLDFVSGVSNHLLVAVNELGENLEKRGVPTLEGLERWLDAGKKVFIDSGIFNLTNEHKRKHGCTMDEALALPPETIDGFDELWKRYIAIMKKYGDRAWGYIELDQGGRDNKRRTRQRLHDLGLNPVPVYHPLNDGWDYFDELAENYDRICFGNVVQADRPTRLRLLATMWERHRKYPRLWIHLLGITPNEWLLALPSNSVDSSSWLTQIRWGNGHEYACMKRVGELDPEMRYDKGADPNGESGHIKARVLAAYQYTMLARNWNNALGAYSALGCRVYPEPTR